MLSSELGPRRSFLRSQPGVLWQLQVAPLQCSDGNITQHPAQYHQDSPGRTFRAQDRWRDNQAAGQACQAPDSCTASAVTVREGRERYRGVVTLEGSGGVLGEAQEGRIKTSLDEADGWTAQATLARESVASEVGQPIIMLGSIASLRSIASRARDELDAADTLAHSVVFSETSGHSAQRRRRRRSDLDADEAEDVLEEEYAPLMAEGESEAMGIEVSQESLPSTMGRSSRSRHHEHALSPEEVVDNSPRVRKLEMSITYIAFFTLGATILLPWNAILVSSTYFGARLQGTSFAESYLSWIAVLFTTANCLFLAHANYSQNNARPSQRIFLSIVVVGACNLLLALSTRLTLFPPTAFFGLLLVIVALQAAGGSYLQNAVVALSSVFGPKYLQGILSGQGAIGAAVALVQLVTALGSTVAVPSATDAPEPGFASAGIRASAFAFFLIGTLFAAISLLFHFVVTRLPFYQLVVVGKGGVGLDGARPKGKHDERDDDEEDGDASHRLLGDRHDEADEDQDEDVGPSMRTVERKVRTLGIAVFWVFYVTLAVFPAVTASVLSVNNPSTSLGTSPEAPDKAPPLWSEPVIFVAIHFLIFNIGDWIGRVLPQIPFFVFRRTWTLCIASAIRTLFIPVFLVCNISTSGEGTVLIRSDALYMLFLLAFSVSNGYVSTLIMIAGVSDSSLRRSEIDIAATVLAFYLTIGLAFGSFSSFAIRALLCRCNPFLQ